MAYARGILWSLVVLAPAAVAADEVVLKNGDKLTGKVMGLAGGKLALETPHSGVVKIDWGQVASVKTDGKVTVTLKTKEVLEGKLSPGQAGRLKVESEGAAQPIEVDPAAVTHFNEPPPQWHGSATMSARTTDGNTHTTQFIATGEAVRQSENDLMLIRFIFRYGERSGDIIERNGYGLGKYQYLFTDRLYGYASVELLSDRFRDLRLGTVVSVGAGYVLLQEGSIDLAAEAGYAYFDNNLRVGEDESHAGARVHARLRVSLPFGFEFKDLFTWYPNFEDHGDWQIRNEATLGTALGGGWSLLGGVITEIDNEPPVGLEEYDNTYFVGVGFAF